MTHNPEIELARKFVQYTNRNIFLTGKAGTGKTTFLHDLKVNPLKRMIVVAPTGVAAINAGGVTIHSFFQLPFGPVLTNRATGKINRQNPTERIHRFSKTKIKIIRTLDLLVIDEISMVRADVLDGIDEVLRRYRQPDLPFGGVQLLLIGDLQQLPPVVKKEEWELLKDYYQTFYFFSSKALAESQPINIELKNIYRQQDEVFIRILNEIRDDRLTSPSIEKLNQCYHPSYQNGNNDGYITLTTHNAGAESINLQKLSQLKTESHSFNAEIQGDFAEYNYPAPAELKLKKGAQVMFLKNDSSFRKQYYNGKIGVVTGLDEDHIEVSFPDEQEPVLVRREEWKNIQYTLHKETKEINEKEIGTFVQYPLKLAWAITIHKSQGLTFEKAVIDAHAAFAHGQTYVALSRCKSLEGLRLSTPLSADAVICDPMVRHFNSQVEENKPDEKQFIHSRQTYQKILLDDLFNFQPLKKFVAQLSKVLDENEERIQGNLKQKLNETSNNHLLHLSSISDKFYKQRKHLFQQNKFPDTDNYFNERIAKAGSYFHTYLENHIQLGANELYYESDNTAVLKSLDELAEKIHEFISMKKACLSAVTNGYETEKYLRARALAVINEPKSAISQKPELSDADIVHPILYQQLKAWRYQQATDADVALYSIVPQKALRLIANELPSTIKQLGSIQGIGKKKLSQHGDDILQIIRSYCHQNEIPVKEDNEKSLDPIRKENTKQISLNLYRQGESIASISKIRELTQATIERHLSHFIQTGDLEITEFVPKEKVETIISLLETNDNRSLSEIKQQAGEDVTYADLHFVLGHLKRIETKKSLK